MAELSTERVQFDEALSNLLSLYSSGDMPSIPTSRLTLINYVKLKLDDLIPEATNFSLDDNDDALEPLNIFVNSFLDESAKRVLLSAPLHVLDPVKSDEGPVYEDGELTGYIPLASNFLRFVSLKMADWKREITDPITTSDKRYKLQQNKYTRGGVAKPVAVFSFRTIESAQTRVVEYYSIKTSHNVDWLYYIQETEAENIPDNLMDALTWYCAGLVLQVTERVDLDKVAFEQAVMCYQNL